MCIGNHHSQIMPRRKRAESRPIVRNWWRFVRRMVVVQGMQLALVGVAIGVASALGFTRLMSSLLYGVKPWDPVTIVLVAVLLSGVTLLATYLPARRASRVDPMVALRYE